NAEKPIDDDVLARREPGIHRAKAIDNSPNRHGAILDAAISLEDQNELSVLVCTDRLILNERHGALLRSLETNTSKQPGNEELRRVLESRANGDRASTRGAAVY